MDQALTEFRMNPSAGTVRPGKKPTIPDEELSNSELNRRNRRRARNREAAARQRRRRIERVKLLKDETQLLDNEISDLNEKNRKLKQEIEFLKFQE